MGSLASRTVRAAKRVTLEEWAELDEDDTRELVDGVLVEGEMTNVGHEIVVSWLLAAVRAWAAPRGGYVLTSSLRVVTGPASGRQPDLSVWLAGDARPGIDEGLVRVPPSIAIEVVSPRPRDGRRDRVDKAREYAAAGVRSYWLVDYTLRTFEVLELDAQSRYVHAASASEGALSPPSCEGLALDLDALWRDLDAFVPPAPQKQKRAKRAKR